MSQVAAIMAFTDQYSGEDYEAAIDLGNLFLVWENTGTSFLPCAKVLKNRHNSNAAEPTTTTKIRTSNTRPIFWLIMLIVDVSKHRLCLVDFTVFRIHIFSHLQCILLKGELKKKKKAYTSIYNCFQKPFARRNSSRFGLIYNVLIVYSG